MQTGMIPQVQDPLVKQTIARLESSKMPPEIRKSYDQIVTAGMQLMWADGQEFDQERESALAKINGPQDVPNVVAHAAIKIISIVQNESKSKDILPGVGPAAILFMCHLLEFVEVAKKIPVTEEILDQTTVLTKEGLLDLYKITKEVLAKLGKGESAPNQSAPATPTTPGPATPSTPGPTATGGA